VAGVAVSLGYTVTVILLVWLGWLTPPIASAVSFALWTPVSYYAHRDFTFRFEGANAAAIVKFTVAFVLKFIASAGVVYVAMEYFGAHYLFGVLMNWVIGPVINYLVLHFWVFRTRREPHLVDSPSP
jgi:putative flippase GtrA